jgi:hypothetical protein
MNLFDVFEDRMRSIFEGNRAAAPFPFKKLAKQAVRQMKRNAVKIDGQSRAPLLYTVLVNPADDVVIAPLYQQITDELVDFVTHEAQNCGLVLTGSPVVRFLSYAKAKPGHFEVVAEAVSDEVLSSLRLEESAYAQNHAGLGRGAVRPQSPVAGRQGAPSQAVGTQGGLAAARRAPSQPAAQTRAVAPAPVAAPAGPRVCELRDAASGRTWRIGVPSTVIGRDESSADLVLPNSNVSRRHAELTSDAAGWHIADLGSTNGTRVNGMRVSAPVDLHGGDTIALGLLTLEFKEL